MAEKLARVTAVLPLAPDVVEIVATMVNPPELPYRPGQFLSVRCGANADGEPLRRSYTLLAAPRPPHHELRLCVRTLASGAGSAFVRVLAPGAELAFTGPMGFFVLDDADRGDLVLVGTGIGMAAILPMLEVLRGQPHGALRVLWGVRADEEAAWGRPRLADLGDAARVIAAPTWAAVHDEIVAAAVATLDQLLAPVYYVAGNGDLIRALRGALTERGVDRKRRFHGEAFFPTVEP